MSDPCPNCGEELDAVYHGDSWWPVCRNRECPGPHHAPMDGGHVPLWVKRHKPLKFFPAKRHEKFYGFMEGGREIEATTVDGSLKMRFTRHPCSE